MTTHTDRKKTRPSWIRTLWAVLATLAALACAFVVIGKFTWGSELYDSDSYWVTADAAFLAGLGVLGFGGLAIRMWQAPQDEVPMWSVWLGAVFWTYFAVGMVAMVIYQASRVGDDDGIGWPILLLLGFFAVLTVWAAIESWIKAWREAHTEPRGGATVH